MILYGQKIKKKMKHLTEEDNGIQVLSSGSSWEPKKKIRGEAIFIQIITQLPSITMVKRPHLTVFFIFFILFFFSYTFFVFFKLLSNAV